MTLTTKGGRELLQAIIDHLVEFLGSETDLHAGDDSHALDDESED